MKPKYPVPDYIIYDELKRERMRRSRQQRPQLEMPLYMPYWPDADEHHDETQISDKPSKEQETERGEVIIPMW